MVKTLRSRDGFIWTPDNASRGVRTDAVVPSSSALKDYYDVVVIGAGFAGLTAARDLVQGSGGNLKVLLLEARDHIGGRTYTAKEKGEEYEMGAQRVHWMQPNVWRELSRYCLDGNLVATTDESEALIGDRAAEVEALLKQFFTIDGLSAKQLLPWPMDPLLDMMPKMPQEYQDLIEMLFSGVSSTPVDDTSFMMALRWYAQSGYSFTGMMTVSGMYKIANGGMTSPARMMLSEAEAGYDRALDSEVTAINQDSKGVTVQMKDGAKVMAQYAICTIPLNVLSTIEFSPALPSVQQEAIRRGMPHMGGKLLFKLAEKQHVYANGRQIDQSTFIFAASDESTKSGTKAVAFTWSGAFTVKNGNYDLTDTQTILPALTDFVKPEFAMTTYLVHDWANGPYAQGAWMTWRPDDMNKCMEALRHTHGRVFKARADWANGCAGFVDGAIEQGAKAAVDAMKALGVWGSL